MKVALTIAGSDPSGGAGIQAGLRTFHQLRVYRAALITVQTNGIGGVFRLRAVFPMAGDARLVGSVTAWIGKLSLP